MLAVLARATGTNKKRRRDGDGGKTSRLGWLPLARCLSVDPAQIR